MRSRSELKTRASSSTHHWIDSAIHLLKERERKTTQSRFFGHLNNTSFNEQLPYTTTKILLRIRKFEHYRRAEAKGLAVTGVQPRTLEVFQTLDLLYTLDSKGNHVSESAFWSPNAQEKLERTHVGPEVVHATPYPWILAVSQRETEEAFDHDLHTKGQRVDRPTQLLSFQYTDDPKFPIQALVKHKFTNTTSIYRCKYMIGSDGAGSTTRRLMGIKSDSSIHDDVWVVADVQLDTDFPDRRRRAVIRSPAGTIMMIPNAGGLNRIYTQLTPKEAASLGGVDESQFEKPETCLMHTEWKDTDMLQILQSRLKEVLAPYTGNIKKIHWISQYRIKQRMVRDFSDGSRVFMVGDACHTHSPKAAQGLNISMMDAYNLTWKLALILQGKMESKVLQTYNTERKKIGEELLEFDDKFAHQFSRKEVLDKNEQVYNIYKKAHGFTTGIGLRYEQNVLIDYNVDVSIDDKSVESLTPGKRLYAPAVVRHIDGSPTSILDDMPSVGRFHLFVFAGNALSQNRLQSCARYLTSGDSILTRYSSGFAREWAFEDIRRIMPENKGRVIDLFLIHTESHHDFDLATLPAPFPEWQYRVYTDKEGKEHRDRGVDPSIGAMVLVRPDGYISLVTGLENGLAITEFMDKFMLAPTPAC